MNVLEEQIRLYARQLKLPVFGEYQQFLRQAEPDLDFGGLLLELMKAELASRQENQLKRRVKAAAFPYLKTLDEFNFSQLNPAVSSAFLKELASCQFIADRRNVIFIGNPGRGKTHLSIALGMKACAAGFRVLFKNAAALSAELCEARDDYSLHRLQKSLRSVDLLILDELSYISFNRCQSELLFTVLSERSERCSTILSTNLPFSRWTELFDHPALVAALVDRLTFRSHVLDMNGESYRLISVLSKVS